MSIAELSPEVFTADYVGEPGKRTFFLQASDAGEAHSYLLEKEQVALLADKLREVLVLIDQADTIQGAPPARDPSLGLVEPIEPEWRVGTISLGYDEAADRVVVVLQPVPAADEEPVEEPGEALDVGARLFLRRDQVRSFVLHSLAAVGEGRPLCQLCGLPMDPGGHDCPARNGHRTGSP